MAKSSKAKTLNAPKRTTWIIALVLCIAGVVAAIVGFTGNEIGHTISMITLFVSSALLLLSSYIKDL